MHCFKATEKHSAISSPGAFLQQAWGDGPYCPHGLSAGGANQGFWQEETIMTCIPQLKRKCIGDAVLIGPVDRTPWAYVCEYKTNRFIFFFCHSYQEAKCLKRGWWFRHAVWGEVINIMSGKCLKVILTQCGGGRAVSVSDSVCGVKRAHRTLSCCFLWTITAVLTLQKQIILKVLFVTF